LGLHARLRALDRLRDLRNLEVDGRRVAPGPVTDWRLRGVFGPVFVHPTSSFAFGAMTAYYIPSRDNVHPATVRESLVGGVLARSGPQSTIQQGK
jgi:hypothetical protein